MHVFSEHRTNVISLKKLFRDAEIEEAKKQRGQDRKQLENQVRAVESQHAKVQKELTALRVSPQKGFRSFLAK